MKDRSPDERSRIRDLRDSGDASPGPVNHFVVRTV